ncbi:MAG TPA: prohibitin family protein [Candidatus Acidoferrales bacterium]|nr:prohibitin family protein [Candidatus Acidoferrales bacterium]
MLLELKRREIDWAAETWFVCKMTAVLLAGAVATIWLFTFGANGLTSASNFGVAAGAIWCIALLVAAGAGLWTWILKFARHFGMLAIVAVVLMSLGGCTKVEPGYVGIKVNLYGKQRGVSDYPIVTGRVWYNPWTQEIYQFPTFLQNVVWTRAANEGGAGDESITFNSREGAIINADVGVSYQFEAAKVPEIFVEFRQPAQVITNVYIRNKVRDALNREASNMPVTDIYGIQKQALLNNVKRDLEQEIGPKGVHFDTISFTSGLRVPPQVEESINAAIEATQRAVQAQNKVAQSRAEAEQRVAEANGIAQSIMIKAKAQSDANNLLNASLSPMLIQYEALQKWNGIMPEVTGGAMPFINMDSLGSRSKSQ